MLRVGRRHASLDLAGFVQTTKRLCLLRDGYDGEPKGSSKGSIPLSTKLALSFSEEGEDALVVGALGNDGSRRHCSLRTSS